MAEERPIFSKGQLQDVLRTREIPKNSKYKIKKNKLTKITEQGEIYGQRYITQILVK